MKESVWYSAVQDEILVRVSRTRVERGCQGIIHVEGAPSVPDYLNLFTWRVPLKKWKAHVEAGLLVKLGDL